MDPLSDIVSRLKISSQKIVKFDMRANTKVLFPIYVGMKIYIAKRGSFFIKMIGDVKGYPIEQGDILILSTGKEFSIYDNPYAPEIDIEKVHTIQNRSSFFSNGGRDFSFVGCRFAFKTNDIFNFINSLPEPILIKTQQEENTDIKYFLSRLSSEIENPGPGSELITEHLLQIILTQALRLSLSSSTLGRGEGWFYAMADKNIGSVISCIHDQPGKKWRLDELSSIAGMSRTSFTSRFRKLAGYSVNEYIRIWRFNLAIERMTANKEKISQIAFDLGYESESAFSTAFKKSMGVSPRSYLLNDVS